MGVYGLLFLFSILFFILLEIVYDNRRKGLDYEEDFQLLPELDAESKDYYVNKNTTDGSDQGE